MSDLVVKIAADASEFEQTLGSLGETFLTKVAGLNPIAATAVAIVGGISAAAVKVAGDWEDAFHTIQQGTGASGDALEGLKADWEAVFKTGDEDAGTVGKTLADVNTLLDITGPTLQKVSRNFLDLAGIVGEDVNTVVKSCSQAFNDWKIQGEDVAKAQDFLMKVNQSTGVSIGELSGQLAESGPILRQFGLSFEESATLIGQLSKLGPGASEAMNGLKKALANMTESGVPAKDALNSIISSIKNAPNDTSAAATAMDIFGKKAGPQLAEQIRAGKFDIDELTKSLQANTNTISDIDNATDGFSAKLGELWNNLQPLLVPLGTVLVDAASALVTGFTDLVKWVGSEGAAGAFKGLFDFVQPVVDAFNNQIKPALETVGSLLLALGVTIIQNALIPALQFLWNNVLAPLGGFLRDVLVTTINGVFGALNSFLDVLSKIPGVSALVESAHKAVNSAMGETKTKADEAKTSADGLKGAHDNLGNTLDKTNPKLLDIAKALKEKKDAAELAKKATSDLEGAESTLADALKKLTLPTVKDVLNAQKDVDTARKNLKTSTDNLAKAEADLKSKLANSNTSAKDLKSAMDALDTAKKNVKTNSDNLTKAQGDLTAAQKKAKEQTDEQKKALDELGKELNSIHVDVVPPVIAGFDSMNDSLTTLMGSMRNAQTDAWDTQKKLEDLGITPKEKLKELADTAKEKYEAIRDSGTASASEIDQAQMKSLQNQVAYYKQAGLDIPPEVSKTLSDLETKYNTHKENVSGKNGIFNQLSTNVKQSITDLTTSLVKSLWEGDGSFGDKALSTLKTLGESVTTAFIQPFNEAITGFIDGALKKLMGKLLDDDGLLGGLGKIGDKITNVFGNAGSGSIPTGGTPSVPTGGGGGGAGAGAAVGSGLAGTVTAIASVGSLISGVIGNFQNARMEGTLNAIEEGTRSSALYLGGRADGGIIMVLFKMLEELSWGTTNKATLEMRDLFKADHLTKLGNIDFNTYWSLRKLEDISNNIAWKIPGQLDQIIAKPTTVVNNIKNYIDGHELASLIQVEVENQIKLAIA